MSPEQKKIRAELALMGFQAPEKYTLKQLRAKLAELKKAAEPSSEDDGAAKPVEAAQEPVKEPAKEPVVEKTKETAKVDSKEPELFKMVIKAEFDFRGVKYGGEKGKKTCNVPKEIAEVFHVHDVADYA